MKHLDQLLVGGVIVRRDHPELAGVLDWQLRTGHLVAILPGVYAVPQCAELVVTRIVAVLAWDSDAVVVAEAAARLSFWPAVPVTVIEIATTRRIERAGFRFVRRRVPLELCVERGGLRLTAPALTALDLCERHGGSGIDEVLRSRSATLSQLRQALDLTRSRRGNTERARLLLDSRDEPWSEAERRAHRLLRNAGVDGWLANFAVRLDGRLYYLDVAFPELKLALEIDGRLHQTDPRVFESDRIRQNLLVLDGWRVLRFTWAMLDDPDEVIRLVTAALRAARP